MGNAKCGKCDQPCWLLIDCKLFSDSNTYSLYGMSNMMVKVGYTHKKIVLLTQWSRQPSPISHSLTLPLNFELPPKGNATQQCGKKNIYNVYATYLSFPILSKDKPLYFDQSLHLTSLQCKGWFEGLQRILVLKVLGHQCQDKCQQRNRAQQVTFYSF